MCSRHEHNDETERVGGGCGVGVMGSFAHNGHESKIWVARSASQ